MASSQAKSTGYVKLYRSLLRTAAFTSSPLIWKFFTYCLVHARHTAGEVRVKKGTITLRAGQLIVGTKKMTERLSAPKAAFTRSAYRNAISTLVNNHLIATRTTKGATIITILGYPDRMGMSDDQDSANNHLNDQASAGSAPRGSRRAATRTTTSAATKKNENKNDQQDDDEEDENNEGVPDTRDASFCSFLQELSDLWYRVTDTEIEWTPEKRDRVARLRETYDIKKAIRKYGEIKRIKTWRTFSWPSSKFFSADVLEEVLGQPLEYFEKRKGKQTSRPDGRLDAQLGDTPLSSYRGDDGDGAD